MVLKGTVGTVAASSLYIPYLWIIPIGVLVDYCVVDFVSVVVEEISHQRSEMET